MGSARIAQFFCNRGHAFVGAGQQLFSLVQAVASRQPQKAGAGTPFYNLIQIFRIIMQGFRKPGTGNMPVGLLQKIRDPGEQKVLIAGIQAHEITVEFVFIFQCVD